MNIKVKHYIVCLSAYNAVNHKNLKKLESKGNFKMLGLKMSFLKYHCPL